MARYCEICHLLSIANYAIIEAVRLCRLCRLPRHITFPPPFPKREDSMSAARHPRFQRRTTAAALKQQILDFLGDALPAGWVKQPLEEIGRGSCRERVLQYVWISVVAV